MSDYPVTEIEKNPYFTPITINNYNVSDDSVRVASHSKYDSYSFKIVHKAVTTSVKESILSHYDADKFNEFNYLFSVTGLTYICQYIKEPLPIWLANDVWTVTTEMRGHG